MISMHGLMHARHMQTYLGYENHLSSGRFNVMKISVMLAVQQMASICVTCVLS